MMGDPAVQAERKSEEIARESIRKGEKKSGREMLRMVSRSCKNVRRDGGELRSVGATSIR